MPQVGLRIILFLMTSLISTPVFSMDEKDPRQPTPQYRPAHHFSPAQAWMNDPNGLLYHEGTWHMFFQHYPYGMTWGPMHWGHATSQDLMTWTERPIALAPDSLGMIFSGSAVIDVHNTSGLGHAGQAPWVAIFTHHDDEAEKAGRIDRQHQSLAYSLDEGQTWQKYAGNPVLPNPGLKDLRDPKVFWHESSARWVMSLAAGDHIAFYSSPNLKDWTLQSRFGHDVGAHGGVWECPDLLSFNVDGQTHWVLIVSVMPGGPNGGSATQYFVGNFDGAHFTPHDTQTRWLDHGPDNYAGVTFHNTAPRTVFVAWMSNWDYAKEVPTSPWRSAMSLPRELSLARVGAQYHLRNFPAQEVLHRLKGKTTRTATCAPNNANVNDLLRQSDGQFVIELSASVLQDVELTFSNDVGDALRIGYDAAKQTYWIDRTQSGVVDFNANFAKRHTAARVSHATDANLSLFFDRGAVELFADQGLTSMTSLHFPKANWSSFKVTASPAMRDTLQIVVHAEAKANSPAP
jgi:fructan beta-fructosidase